MKNKSFIILTSLIAFFATSSFAAEEKYAIEPTHTSVTWKANHFGFSKPSGKFTDIDGAITFNEKEPQKSSVEVNIKTAGLFTGLIKFDEHLKSADFFNTTKFPVAKFVSKKIKVTGKNKAQITGDLTILDKTKSVNLDAIFNKSGINPINQKQTIGFSATTTIKRSDFGLNYALPAIDDLVEIAIEVEANR